MVSGGCVCAVFFCLLILVAVCGVLHGFGSELCIFMAFYTAIEGTLLSNGRNQAAFFEVLDQGFISVTLPCDADGVCILRTEI